jgi:hypothetical protein
MSTAPRPPLRAGVKYRLLVFLAAVVAFCPSVRADMADNAKRYQDDLRLLATRVAQYRFTLRASRDGAQRLAVIEVELAHLKANVDELVSAAGEVDAQDRRLHYLKEMEVDPRQRELDRLQQINAQRYEQLRQEKAALDARWAAYAATKHTFITPQESAAYAAAWVVYNGLIAQEKRYNADLAQANAEANGTLDKAVEATTKAQRELSAAETKREQSAQELKDLADRYGANRAPLVEQLMDLDNAPAPVRAPLTAFPHGVPPSEAGLVPRAQPPVGPGSDTHALDQLRVVTASSLAAAGQDASGQTNGAPAANVTAKTVSGYEFDSAGGMNPVPLPDVAAPEAQPVAPAVPLVMPPPEDVPAAAKDSPKLSQADQRQADNFKKLEQLYAERQKLARQGPAASPEDWTRVVKEISTAHAEITTDAVVKKLAKGSRFIDTTVAPAPAQEKGPDRNSASQP